MADRSRRERKSNSNKLAEYKRAREGGSRSWKQEEDTDLYDEVSEDQYKSIVRGRLAKDDFVVDDGISGYMDNGMDDWGAGDEERADSEEESTKNNKSKKKKGKGIDEKSRGKPKAPPPSVVPSITAYRPAKSAEQEEDFMASVLGDMNAIPTTKPTKSRKRKPSPEAQYRSHDRSSSPPGYAGSSSDGLYDDIQALSSDDIMMSPMKKMKTDVGVTPAIERFTQLDVHSSGAEDFDFDASFDEIDDDLLMDVDLDNSKPVIPKPKTTKTDRNLKVQSKPANGRDGKKEKTDDGVPAWLSVYDSLSVTTDDTLGSSIGTSSSSVNASKISALEPDGSLRFFWLDYLEHEGKIYFVGKLKDKTSGTWISCCVTVEGLQRNLFVLPRDRRIEKDEDGDDHETDIVPQPPDVYSDFDAVRRRAGVKSWKAKFVKRKYAFGEKDVPRGETQWMKVVYGFDEPQIQTDVSSPNFSRIFGTNTTAFELLVIKRKIMGPCWLQIKNPQLDNKGVSWCKLEATVSDPKNINPFSESDPEAPKETPPLTVTSLSIRTIVNHKENKREIVCVTARIWSNLQIEDPTPPESLPCSVHTFVRPLDRFPPSFEARAKANSKGYISPMKNERMLLNSLLVTLHKADPDVIIGHEFLGVSLDVLLHRMRELKADHWSRIGRFRRSKWPNIGRQGTNIKFMNGRLLCDLASDGAKGMIVSTTWSLTEMCKTYLKNERQDIDPDDTAGYFDGTVSSPDRLLTFVRHCELDAHYQMALAAKVQILPLTKQLTNLAGNSWNKTLNGGRAERNEYILLHEFHRLKYVCPDKFWQKRQAAVKKEVKVEEDDEGDGKTKKTKPKRDKYKGGLVFDPKRGLWDKYVLVMDFNSLYPSIIQEYNIDFTTIQPVEDEEDENGEEIHPDPPTSDVGQGVLPRLIATLVNRRRQVKSLMKDKTITPAKLLQYDLKQMALKLTANSMYGCLGFENSRFYARALASLTTYKGREILMATKELAESLQLDVLYGDTDSIFVNSNVTELSEAMNISNALRKAVNDRYKLLEIDLDSVFQRLLLLQKKKYAAIKVEQGDKTTTEVKGLDMKRREFCVLSKSVSQYVLDQILSGEATETVVERIHEYLRTISENVREGRVQVDDFIIFKRLGKDPEGYPDAKNQPHVQVALRMKSKGGTARAGDVVPYIFCLGPGGETSKTGQADRARHPDEVRKVGSDCQIDFEHYLSQQILPPIERLCEPIEGTDRSRLAECLGLDPSRYRSSSAGDAEERYFGTLDSQIPESQRYQDADPFRVRCRNCKEETEFVHIGDREKSLLFTSGPACPSCKQPLGIASVQVQLQMQIREHISKYYLGWTICDDPTCGSRTRMMSVYGKRCLKAGCLGRVSFEYSDAQLYNQLRFYSFLFDGAKARKNALGSLRYDEVVAVTGNYSVFLDTMGETVNRYLDQNGRRWVDMSGLFSFMKV